MGLECAGTYNGIPVYVDQYMDRDKIMTVKKQRGKPNPERRVSEPRTKGLDHDSVTAYIMHPDSVIKLKKEIRYGTTQTR